MLKAEEGSDEVAVAMPLMMVCLVIEVMLVLETEGSGGDGEGKGEGGLDGAKASSGLRHVRDKYDQIKAGSPQAT